MHGRDNGHAAVHRQLLPDPPAVGNPLARGGNAELPSVGDLVPALHLRGPGHEGHHEQGLERGVQAVGATGVHLQPCLDRSLPDFEPRIFENPAALEKEQKLAAFEKPFFKYQKLFLLRNCLNLIKRSSFLTGTVTY